MRPSNFLQTFFKHFFSIYLHISKKSMTITPSNKIEFGGVIYKEVNKSR